MKLNHGIHLAYCTNIHRGENWVQTFDSLQNHAMKVRDQVSPSEPFAIGLRLSHVAAVELRDPAVLVPFQRWLEKNNSYVFTINGFPYGQFHGQRVKEQVYRPDWTAPGRLDYTNLLFDLLAELVPSGVEGSVSTLPGSFKEFIHDPAQEQQIRDHIWKCVEHIAKLGERTGKVLHLGLEPEPLGYFETSAETVSFFQKMRSEHPGDSRLQRHLGVNYDTCHLAVEFEEPQAALGALLKEGIKISKLHLSSAMKLQPTPEHLRSLAAFADEVYLHQVVERSRDGKRRIFKDLPQAIQASDEATASGEWRVHFHVPLHCPRGDWFETTADHALGVLDMLRKTPGLCRHLEMETYTWEVLPENLRSRSVEEQLVAEYRWTLGELMSRGLAAG